MDSSKEIFKQIKEQDASGFGCITDQKLLFLDQNSFLQQGGHRGDEDKMQEHDQEQLKDKHIFLSEVVGNDTIQFQKFTEDDVFVSAEDPRFYDLQPQNKGILTDFPHEVVFKNCTSKYTLSDVLSKNCNTPLKHQKLQSYDFTIKPQRSKSDIQNPKDLSAIPQSDQQIAAESILQNSAEKEVSVGNKLVVQNQPAVDFAQQKRNSTNQNLDNNFSIKRNLIAISNRLKSDKISSSYVEHNNLHSTCTPNNRISRQLKSNKISSNQNSNHIKNLVTKLIDSLKKPQFQYYTKFFQFAEHKFIEDKTIFWDSKEKTEQQKTALRNFSDIVQVFIRNIFIFERLIERTDVFLKMWNCFQFLFFTALIFIYSIDSAFNYEILGNNSRNVLFAMCFCFLFGESLINQNMEQYYNDQIITDKKQIQDQYFRKGLLFDLLLLIILSIKLVFLNKSIENIYSLQIILDLTIIFFYTLKFYKLSQIIYEICLNEWQQKTFEITKILISNLVIAHLSNYFNFFVYFQLTFYLFKKSVTISLIYLCNIEAKLGYNQNMLSNLDYLGNDLVHKYLIVYFWAITSLTIYQIIFFIIKLEAMDQSLKLNQKQYLVVLL